MKLNSVMSHNFAKVPDADIPRSSFDRSHGHKTTLDAGYLVPVFLDEALPGDTFNLKMTSFARIVTLQVPVMDNIVLDSFFFAVPYRLVWDNWEKFNGSQDNPGDSTDFLVPTMTAPAGGYQQGSLSDYFGIPTATTNATPPFVPNDNITTHSSLWHRAYNLIWNEWFRDENLQDSVVVDKDDGPDDPIDYTLLRRGKRYDYFTSCLPFPQKGPAVPLPLSGTAPVVGIGKGDQTYASISQSVFETGGTNPTYPTSSLIQGGIATTATWIAEDINNPGFPGIYADLSQATASTINQLREAFQIQKLYERDARGGTRYVEIIRSHFNVTSPDFRLQRPEYLGGGSSHVTIAPVAQTVNLSTSEDFVGELGAYGTSVAHGHGFTKSFTEHCLIIGLVNIRADLTYQQGLNRMFSRSGRFDFYWPALSHIGEQEVLNKEIYADGTAADDLVFGYQERYAEYRYKPSLVTGQFRSTYSAPLDIWHLSQAFTTLPALGDAFIQDNPPIDRISALTDDAYPHFVFDSYFSLKCARPMPVYSVPGMIDHF